MRYLYREIVVITKHGKPVAKLQAIPQRERRLGTAAPGCSVSIGFYRSASSWLDDVKSLDQREVQNAPPEHIRRLRQCVQRWKRWVLSRAREVSGSIEWPVAVPGLSGFA